MEIQWEEPPEYANVIGTGGGTGRYLEFALTLRQHPGRWAVLPGDQKRTEKGAMATAQNIRRGKVKGFKPNQYDTAIHGTKIWVRYKTDQPAASTDPTPGASPSASPRRSGSSADADTGPDAKVVRAWAIAQGEDVPERGRLPRRFIDSFEQAVARGEINPDGTPASPDSQNGTGSGGVTDAEADAEAEAGPQAARQDDDQMATQH